MKNRLFALLLVVALVVTVSVFAVGAETSATPATPATTATNPFDTPNDDGTVTAPCQYCGGEDKTWTPVTGTLPNVKGSHCYLPSDVTAGYTEVSKGGTYCLELNGHTYARETSGRIFQVYSTTLNIFDSSAEKTGKIMCKSAAMDCLYVGDKYATINLYSGSLERDTASTTKGYAVNFAAAGTFNMRGGAIRNFKNANGAAIYNPGGTCNIMDGIIENCVASNYGGAYYGSSAAAKLNFSGGEIKNCSAPSGGAMYFQWQAASNTMSGTAKITDCTATGWGGAMFFTGTSKPSMLMSGGTISGCTAGKGGAVYMGTSDGGTFEMTGGTIIGGNKEKNATTDGGAVYVAENNTFKMSGESSISGCIAGGSGGNIYGGGTITITGGTITGGKSTSYGGNIYIASGCTAEISNAIISNGTAGNSTYDANSNDYTEPTLAAARGGNIAISADCTLTGCTITGGQSWSTGVGGGNIYYGGGTVHTIDGCTITGGQAYQSGGNIAYHSLNGKLTVQGESLIKGGKSEKGWGGNLVAIASGTATIEIIGDTVIDGTGAYAYRKAGAAAAAYGNNIASTQAGNKLYIGGNAQVKNSHSLEYYNSVVTSEFGDNEIFLSGDASVDCIYLRKPDSDVVTIQEGFTGNVQIATHDSTVNAGVTYGADAYSALTKEDGYNNTGVIKLCDSGYTGLIVAHNGTKFVVCGYAGIKGTGVEGEYTEVGIPTLDNAAEYDYIKLYKDNDEITLTSDLKVDMNKRKVTFNTDGHKLTVFDNETDDGTVSSSKIFVDNEANLIRHAQNPINGYHYVVVGNKDDGFTSNRVQVTLDKLSIKTAYCGIYYTTTIKTNANVVEADVLLDYGTAVSLADTPDENFLEDPTVLFTTFENDQTTGNLNKTTRSAVIQGILKEENDSATNTAHSDMEIFANSYVTIDLGTGEPIHIMAEKPYVHSLNSAMKLLDDRLDSLGTQLDTAVNFYTKWKALGGFEGADLPNFVEAAEAAGV